MQDVIIFLNKMKAVINSLSDEEFDIYIDIYNKTTEEFVAWINKEYEKLLKNKYFMG